MGSALYVGGDRTPGRYFKLNILKGVDDARNLHVTRKAVEQVGGGFGGSIYGLSPEGIMVGGRISAAPFIYLRIRNGRDHAAHKLFIADSELAGLSGEFGLTPRAAERSFFIFPRTNNFKCDSLNIAPVWSELLDPDWRDAFLNWLADPGRNPLPDPDWLAWQTFSGTALTMPALGPTVSLHGGRVKVIKGELVLKTVAGSARAHFRYDGWVSVYLLGENRVEYLGKDLAGSAADFDKGIFLKLFGDRPGITNYAFSKQARKEGVFYMNVRGERFVLRASAQIPLKEGALYYFNFFRRAASLLVYCFADEGRTRLLGGKRISLIGGFPGSTDQVIEPPDHLPPNLV